MRKRKWDGDEEKESNPSKKLHTHTGEEETFRDTTINPRKRKLDDIDDIDAEEEPLRKKRTAAQSHHYSRAWFFESLYSYPSPHEWKKDDMTKILFAVAEKFIREKKTFAPHIEAANVLLTQYHSEVFDLSQDVSVFHSDCEHVVYLENIQYAPPHETPSKSDMQIRLLPDQCNKRGGQTYSYQVLADMVYKVYKCPVPYPAHLLTPTQVVEGSNPPVYTFTSSQEQERSKFEKEWIRVQDLRKKELGRDRYYAQYKPEDVVKRDVLPRVSMGFFPATLGSLICHRRSPTLQPGEGLFDPDGTFAPGGTYRIIPPLKDLVINQDFVDVSKDNAKEVVSEVWSSAESRSHHSTQTFQIYYNSKLDKNKRCKRELELMLPFSKRALDITVIFLALGFTPQEMIWTVRQAARSQWKESYAEILNVVVQNCRIKTREMAYLAIANVENKNLKLPIPFLMRSSQVKLNQQLLPRLGQTEAANSAKARWLGFLIWRLLIIGEKREKEWEKAVDPAKQETEVVLNDMAYPIPKWMRVEKRGESRQKRKDRDHLANARSDFSGVLEANLIRQIFCFNWKQVRNHLQATLNKKQPIVQAKFLKNVRKLSARILYCVTTGKWSSTKDKESRQNVSKPFSMVNAVAQESEYTYHSTSMNADGKNPAPRMINESQTLYFDPAETPETKKCGLTGHSAQAQEFCVGSPASELEKSINFYQEELEFIPDFRWIEIYDLAEDKDKAFDPYTFVVLNGKPVGFTLFPETFVKYFQLLRRTLTVDPYASIYYEPVHNVLHLRCERGRVTVPCLIFPRLHHLLRKLPQNYLQSKVPPNMISAVSQAASFTCPGQLGPRALLGIANPPPPFQIPESLANQKSLAGETLDFHYQLQQEQASWESAVPWTVLHTLGMSQLLSMGVVDFLDPCERKMTVIALQEEDYWLRLQAGQKVFTHIALDPHFMFSVSTGLTPLPDHSQSPRLTYIVAMKKSAVELLLNQHLQQKTKHELLCSHAPLMRTVTHAYRNDALSCNQITPLTAQITYQGFSVEDAQNMSRAFTKRGAGLMTTSKMFRIENRRKKPNANQSREAFGKPNLEECMEPRYAKYTKINEDGIPPEGTLVENQDVIIGQTLHYRAQLSPAMSNAEKTRAQQKKRRDNSVVYNQDEKGYVASSLAGTTGEGHSIAKVIVRLLRSLEKGDKVTTKNAQKGTLSVLFSTEDGPEVADGSGVCMEYLINSQALPKRMTGAMPIEQGFSLAICEGYVRFSDGTSFRHQMDNIEELKKALKVLGFSCQGSVMRDGCTGKEIESLIYWGPLSCVRLKHVAADKEHVRSFGPVNFLTRQPVEGRAKQGGLRFGEMERSCLSAQNAALLQRQQMHDLADPFKIPICRPCRVFASKHILEKRAHCHMCKSRDVLWVDISYAFKLLTQELLATMIYLQPIVEPVENPKDHLYTCLREEDLIPPRATDDDFPPPLISEKELGASREPETDRDIPSTTGMIDPSEPKCGNIPQAGVST